MKFISEDGTVKDLPRIKKQNEICFVMDSVGWKEFKKAKTPNIDKIGKSEPATAPSFYTTPSVHCILHGLVPQPLNRTFWPYGRYCRAENSIIPLTYQKHGYNTYLMSSNPIITNLKLVNDTEVISYNPYFMYANDRNFDTFSSDRLIGWFIKRFKEPFWAFFIVIESHTPYLGKDKKSSTQIKSIEVIDKSIGTLVKSLRRLKCNTRIIICGDHSEAWDNVGTKEEKNYGHNPRWFSEYIRRGKLMRLLRVPLIVGEI